MTWSKPFTTHEMERIPKIQRKYRTTGPNRLKKSQKNVMTQKTTLQTGYDLKTTPKTTF